jgi:hypothetical protein
MRRRSRTLELGLGGIVLLVWRGACYRGGVARGGMLRVRCRGLRLLWLSSRGGGGGGGTVLDTTKRRKEILDGVRLQEKEEG